jgi:serine/threonine protein kinase
MKPLARISLVMPFYSLGSLGERLRHDKLPRLSWLHKLLLCWDIVSGIMDSHKAAVIHKDIKCDNIVLEQDALDLGDNTLLRGVVCDFGLANVAKQVRGASFCCAVPGSCATVFLVFPSDCCWFSFLIPFLFLQAGRLHYLRHSRVHRA